MIFFSKIKEKYAEYKLKHFLWSQIKWQVRAGFKGGRFICMTGWLKKENSDGLSIEWNVKSTYYRMTPEQNAHIAQFIANGFLKEVETRMVRKIDNKGEYTALTVPLEIKPE